MKRFIVVILLAVGFSLIALYMISPEIVEKIWLWVVGFLGIIVAFFQRSFEWTGDKIKTLVKKQTSGDPVEKSTIEKEFMQIYRYSRNGNRILGLIFVEGQFIGISNENSSNSIGVYSLNIQQNRIILSNGAFTSSFVISTNGNLSEKDIGFSVDQNRDTNDPRQVYNTIFEQLAHILEGEKQPSLQVFNPDYFR
ncbi:MAG: hypothetical protein WCP85_13570 [Mariniphaga sp.]